MTRAAKLDAMLKAEAFAFAAGCLLASRALLALVSLLLDEVCAALAAGGRFCREQETERKLSVARSGDVDALARELLPVQAVETMYIGKRPDCKRVEVKQ